MSEVVEENARLSQGLLGQWLTSCVHTANSWMKSFPLAASRSKVSTIVSSVFPMPNVVEFADVATKPGQNVRLVVKYCTSIGKGTSYEATYQDGVGE